MPAVILDACGILNLYASGRFLAILSALRNDWYVPAAVEREAQQYRQPDPSDPAKLIAVPINLKPAIDSKALTRCDCENEAEMRLYVEIAARIEDDGESMGLAIAKCRGWTVFTDDKKARRIASELGVSVVETTAIMKQWADIALPGAAELASALESIERFANFIPGRTAVEQGWWQKAITGK
jgi:predicted nucleic acid-binding protein